MINGLNKYYNTASIGMDADGIKEGARKPKMKKDLDMIKQFMTKKNQPKEDEGLLDMLGDDTASGIDEQLTPNDIFEDHSDDVSGEEQYHEDMQDVEKSENAGLKSPAEATAEQFMMTDEHIADEQKDISMEVMTRLETIEKMLRRIARGLYIEEEAKDDDSDQYEPKSKKKSKLDTKKSNDDDDY